MILHTLLELGGLALVAWWLDRRQGEGLRALLAQLEAPAEPFLELGRAEPPPELPPAPAGPCQARRGSIRCTLAAGHQGDHSGRTGVSWRGSEP